MSYLGELTPPFYTNWGYASATSGGLLSAGTQTLGGNKTWVVPHVDSSAETLAGWRLDEDTSSILEFLNASATNAKLIPMIRGTQSGTDEALHIRAAGTTDTGVIPLWVLGSRIGTSTDVSTRPLGSFRNNGTEVASIGAKGAWTFTMLHTDSAAETLATWKLDEDTNSSLTFINGTSANATFNPFIVGTQSAATLALGFQAKGTTDSGSVALMEWDSRIGASTNVATRSPFVWYNNGTEVLSITGTTAGSSLKTSGGRIRKVRVALTTPVTVAVTDDIVQIKLTTPAAVAVSLPASPVAGREFTIQDATGDAGANNITITPAAGNINGAGTLVMNANYQRKVLQYDSSATAQWLAG